MPQQMWFGTVDGVAAKLQWVPQPARGMKNVATGWSQTVLFENGGANVARSTGSHKVYEMDFPMQENLNLDVFNDYASGQYGQGRVYFADPMTMDQNMLPKQWAAPMECGVGGFPYIGNYKSTATTVPTAGNPSNLPMQTPTFTVGSTAYVVPTDPAQSVVVPIPPTHRLFWGWRGTVTGSGVLNMLAHRISDGVMVNFSQTPIAPTSTSALVNTPISGATYDWARLYITRSTTGNPYISGNAPSYVGNVTGVSGAITATSPTYTVSSAPSTVMFMFGAEINNKGTASLSMTPSNARMAEVTSASGTAGTRTHMVVATTSTATTTAPSAAGTWPAGPVFGSDSMGNGVQSIAFRGTPTYPIANPTTNGMVAVSQSATSTLTIPNYAQSQLQTGDILVAALRSSAINSPVDWTNPAFIRQGPAFVPNHPARVTGLYTHVVEDPTKEPFSYVFNTGGSGRAVGALILIRGVTLDNVTVSPTSVTAQLWPIAVTPTLTGSHISGKGDSGCRFDGDAIPITYVLRGNDGRNVHLVGMNVALRETGAWESA